MTPHTHFSSEDILDRLTSGDAASSFSDCRKCGEEAASVVKFLAELRTADAAVVATTEWDDMLLRSRIREAVSKEPVHSAAGLPRFFLFRPAFISALAACLVFAIWSPLSRYGDSPVTSMENARHERLPAWTPLPDESDDEGLAVLAEWKPNEDEFSIARCRAACFGGLGHDEEENLLQAMPPPAAPLTGSTPL